MTVANPESVEFWFDPSCPWCWMTSRWITEVSEVRGFTVNWRPFSLKILNEGRDKISDRHKTMHAGGLQTLRVIEAARQAHGAEVVGALYTEIGERIHPGGRTDYDAIIAEALDALDLPSELAAYADAETSFTPGDSGVDAALRDSTAAGLKLVGKDVGIPIVAVNGKGLFGPVVTPAPQGQAALDLFDALVLATGVEGFYELKRTRTARPQF
ncbi:DsbA family protein [Canibacter zhoujuaniae]|uniref:mycothiol-dependent nitroreductase Rv2466c family protein n=1 Tax=Canibacter zhoujuaniae TaxID=2708343 RepID=UPI0014227AB2|nr:DsbA family protein [Canibacter zhoujuaniae]